MKIKKIVILILILGLFTINKLGDCIAQQEDIQAPHIINNFSDGYNTDIATNLLSSSESPDILNCIIDESPSLISRGGTSFAYQLPVSTNVLIVSKYVAEYSNGTSQFIVQAGSGIYCIGNDNIWTTIINGISSKSPFNYTMYNDEVWGTNGIDAVGNWTGTVYSSYTFIPKGKYITTDKEQILIAGIAESPSSVMFSNATTESGSLSSAKNQTDWNDLNELFINSNDGQVITGLFKLDNKVYVTKEKSTYGLLTNADYKDAEIYNYNNLYGCISDKSINNYKDATIMLNKNGLYLYNGGKDFLPITSNLDNIFTKIGKISTAENRITITSNADFSTGTYTNSYNNNGTVEISTSQKVWTLTSDFQNGATGTTNIDTSNNEIKINTQTAGGYTKLNLSYNNYKSGGVDDATSQTVPAFGEIVQGSDSSGSVDTNDGTFLGLIYTVPGVDLWTTWTTTATCSIDKLRIRYRNQRYGYTEGGSKKFVSFVAAQSLLTYGGINLMNDSYSLVKNIASIATNSDIQDIEYTPEVNASKIQIFVRPSTAFLRVIESDSVWFYNNALLVYDLSAYTKSTTISNYPTAFYVSPATDTASTTTQYQFLTFTDYKGTVISSGTNTVYARSDDNAGMTSPTAWYTLGTDSATNTAIDGQRYFQFASSMTTSSTTFTPIIRDITLQYATSGYATYTSKVFNIGIIDSLGSIVADYDGDVTFKIRGSTYALAGGETTVYGSSATNWTTITNGQDISSVIPSYTNYIQLQYLLNSKNSKVYGTSLTYNKNSLVQSGGTQDIASITYKDKYYFAYSTYTTYNTDVLIFNKNGKFTHFDWKVFDFAVFNNKFYILSSTQPIISEVFVGTTDNGQPINFKWTSGDLDFGSKEMLKSYRYIYLTGKKQNSFAILDTYIDFSTYTINSRYIDFTNNANHRLVLDADKQGKNFKVIVHSTATISPEIQNISIFYKSENLQ